MEEGACLGNLSTNNLQPTYGAWFSISACLSKQLLLNIAATSDGQVRAPAWGGAILQPLLVLSTSSESYDATAFKFYNGVAEKKKLISEVMVT